MERSTMKKCLKVLLTLCIILGMISSTAYAEEEKPFEYEDASIIAIVEGILTEVNYFTDYELDYYAGNSLGITKTICEEYRELRENDTLGDFVKFKDSKIENTKNAAIVTVTAAYEKTDVKLTVTYMEIKNGGDVSIVPTDIKLETVSDSNASSKLDSVKNAALNTLMGICIVVLMLTLISFIISLFKYIPKLQNKLSKKKEAVIADKGEDRIVEQIIEKEELREELSNDTELVAVITAAICAAQNVSGDSFVVRTIRKSRFK